MRLIKMTGGLGNQLFIYAFYMQMKCLHPNTRIDLSDMMHYHVHHGYELHRIFPTLPYNEFCINQKLKKVIEFLFFKTLLERKQDLSTLRAFFCKRLWPLIYFKGFYQDERYFKPIEADVRRAFTFNPELCNEQTKALAARITADPKSVSLHVRRGDYLQPSVWRNTGCVCQEPYYRDAIKAMSARVSNVRFYVFSDDIEWARAHLPLPTDTVFVSHNSGFDSWQDMYLMSLCRHNIICNSTFSWWGAWLNAHSDKTVMAPSQWSAQCDMPNICPKEWVRIPVDIKL